MPDRKRSGHAGPAATAGLLAWKLSWHPAAARWENHQHPLDVEKPKNQCNYWYSIWYGIPKIYRKSPTTLVFYIGNIKVDYSTTDVLSNCTVILNI